MASEEQRMKKAAAAGMNLKAPPYVPDKNLKAPPYVPLDVIETIMYGLPVKSLLRFKTVCKSWEATISDPRFTHTYTIQQPETHNLFLTWVLEPSPTMISYSLIKLENGKPQITLKKLVQPLGLKARTVCSCNGIVLLQGWESGNMELTLWNPFIDKQTTVPDSPFNFHPVLNSCGLYYDPSIDDYKVVVISDECYSVFSCKSGSWGGKRLHSDEHRMLFDAVFFDGYFYLCRSGEIECFDVMKGEWRTVQELKYGEETDAETDCLIVMSGRLYLYRWSIYGTRLQVLVMEKRQRQNWNGAGWREVIKMERPELDSITGRPIMFIGPVCLTNEDDVVIRAAGLRFLIYNTRDKRFEDTSDIFYYRILLGRESLAFPRLHS